MPSYADSDVIFKAVHLPLNGGGRLILSDGLEASCKLVLKLFWDSEKSASSDFTLRKRKKYAVAIFSKQGGWLIVLMSSPFEVLDMR
jgi:hypothetical protein